MEQHSKRNRALWAAVLSMAATLAFAVVAYAEGIPAPDWPDICPLSPCNGGPCQYVDAKPPPNGVGMEYHEVVEGNAVAFAYSPAGGDDAVDETPTGDAALGGANGGTSTGQNALPAGDGQPADTQTPAAQSQTQTAHPPTDDGEGLVEMANGVLAQAAAFLDSGTLLGMSAKTALILIGALAAVVAVSLTVFLRLRRRYRKKR